MKVGMGDKTGKVKLFEALRKRFTIELILVLWQPLITKTNDHTSGKFLKSDIK